MIVEFIDDTVSGIFRHRNTLIAPMALTIFVWVFLMNLMDLVPVDWIPEAAKAAGVHHMKDRAFNRSQHHVGAWRSPSSC